MLFNSLTFVLFFAIVVSAYWMMDSWRGRKNLLLIASYIFYGAWNPPFAALLFGTTAMDFYLGRQMAKATRPGARKVWLIISVAVNLSMLGFFKYGNFLLENFQWVLARGGITYKPPHLDVFLPIAISFYTFHSLSYTLVIYRGVMGPTRSLRDFALAVSFFPQLVAGPIVRAGDFLPQLEAPPKPQNDRFLWGLVLMTLGLFEKVVLADTMLAGSADSVFGYAGPLIALDSWLGVIAFAGQIFFDFAGYSTCAIGAALCLGFHLKDNFRFPYAAIGFSDFWRRWHISLSTFLRDYLYIPLGGNRSGAARAMINLIIVMFIGGLWHGAAWTFVVWGLLHGSYLVIERLLKAFVRPTAWDGEPRRQTADWPRHLRSSLPRMGLFPGFGLHRRYPFTPWHVRRARSSRCHPVDTRDTSDRHRHPWHVHRPMVAPRNISRGCGRAPSTLGRDCGMGFHGRRPHPYSREQQCIHLLSILSAPSRRNPGAASRSW